MIFNNDNFNNDDNLGLEFALVVISDGYRSRYYCPNPQCNELIPDFYLKNYSTKCPRCKISVYLDCLEEDESNNHKKE